MRCCSSLSAVVGLLIAGVVVVRWLLTVAVDDCYCCVLLMFVFFCVMFSIAVSVGCVLFAVC